MGLVKLSLDVGTKAGGIFFHRATRRAKGRIAQKAATAAASATASVAAEESVRLAGNEAERRLDENGKTGERYSLTGQFIPDSTLTKIGEFALFINPVNLIAMSAAAGAYVSGRAAEAATGLVSKRLSRRIRRRTDRSVAFAQKIGRFGKTKRQHKKSAERMGKMLDITAAAAEMYFTGGTSGIAGKVGTKVGSKVAGYGLKRMSRNAARRAARETLKRSVGKTTLKAAATAAI